MLATDRQTSPFLNASSVHVWDSCFRLRECGRLRDLSIEATWERCARALCADEPHGAQQWAGRVLDALSGWQLLIDERILATAGSRDQHWPADAAAVLNAAAFVTAPLTDNVRFDYERFAAVAGLAVRCLDNVQLHSDVAARGDLRVGIIGLADALVLLGKRYDSPAGRVCAGRIAQALAEGCLQASVALAAERGPLQGFLCSAQGGAARPAAIAADISRFTIRHRQLTAITSQPRLAELANEVSDALDPIALQASSDRQTVADGHTFAIALAHSMHKPDGALRALLARVSLASQIEMRGAVQRWVDAPIDYPFRVTDPDAVAGTVFWQRLASAHRLGRMTLVQA